MPLRFLAFQKRRCGTREREIERERVSERNRESEREGERERRRGREGKKREPDILNK